MSPKVITPSPISPTGKVLALRDPRLSDEVKWYLKSRQIPFPKFGPKFMTPEPTWFKGAQFDAQRVDRVLEAFRRLRHTQGAWAGKPLNPDPWQVAYIIAPVFGWVAPDEYDTPVRIIRKVHAEVPRKNGKTTLAGGIACYLTTADGEEGAQVFAVATATRQAQYCFAPVRLIAQKSPDLSPYVIVTTEKIIHKSTGSYFAVVSSVADLLHGANVHGAIVDELHVHKNGDIVSAVETGMGARRQPLMLVITTADDSRSTTIYAQKRERIEQLARGAFRDPSTYGVIWAADRQDDPFAEETWKVANPGYPISPTKRYMEDAAREAAQSPAQLAAYLRLHLNIRTKQDTRYLNLPDWDASEIEGSEDDYAGQVCYGGLDLSSTTDLAAFSLDFPQPDAGHVAFFRCFAPEQALGSLNHRTAGAASFWVSQGWLTLTPGPVVNYKFIREQINQDRKKFQIKEIAYDPWNATEIITNLQEDGAPMVEMRQGYASMSAPTKRLQALLIEGTKGSPKYRHLVNGCMRWQIDNFAVDMDPQMNVKPSKLQASDKIDGPVAGIMALARAMVHMANKKAAYLGSA